MSKIDLTIGLLLNKEKIIFHYMIFKEFHVNVKLAFFQCLLVHGFSQLLLSDSIEVQDIPLL